MHSISVPKYMYKSSLLQTYAFASYNATIKLTLDDRKAVKRGEKLCSRVCDLQKIILPLAQLVMNFLP